MSSAKNQPIIILGIEASCDDTSAAVLADNCVLSNVIASQAVHQDYGGVVPELASRAHQKNIIPVVEAAIRRANIGKQDIDAVAFTLGPGLLGSLLVGTSFAKSFATALGIPCVDVNHLQAHVLSVVPFPMSAGIRWQLADSTCPRLLRYADNRADHRRRCR